MTDVTDSRRRGRRDWRRDRRDRRDRLDRRHGRDSRDLSGIVIDGHGFRFAACQFGQMTAGSQLGSIVRAVARFFARLTDPVHVSAWVDDLIFVISTPEHGECTGFEGGCEVCAEYHGRALKVQEIWQERATRLANGGVHGVAIDMYRGWFNMLPEKLWSMVAARDELAAAEVSTPRRVSRVRGKAIHYGSAIPFVAVAAPSLSQLMHDRETGTGPVEVPALEAKKEMEFDWDQELRVTARAREALEFMRVVLERYGAVGQPLWPVVPSSLYGAFLAGGERRAGAGHHLRRQCARLGDSVTHVAGRAGSGGSRRLPLGGGRSSSRRHSRTVLRRRCTGRHLPASWQRRRQANCTRWLTSRC